MDGSHCGDAGAVKPVGLTNAELPVGDRPPRIAPPLPDVVPTERPWHGPAGADAEHWRKRALAAESERETLRAELRNAVGALSDAMQTLRVIEVAERRLVVILGRQP